MGRCNSMSDKLRRLLTDQRGNVFIEVALVVILLAFAVAPYLFSLGSTTGTKIDEMTTKIGEVGTP